MGRPNRLYTRLIVLVVLSLLVVAALSGTGLAQAPEGSAAPGEVSEALLKDTGAYAAAFGVSLDEAVRRLQLQEDIGNLNAKLEAEQADTFAGLWIEHQPQYRVVAAFTHDGEATIKPYIEGTALAGIVVVRSANATLAELKSARAQAASMAESVGVPAYSALDVPANTAHLYVLDPEALGAAFESADVGLSPHVLVLAVREFPKLVTDIYGGVALSSCTSGFSVIDGGGSRGVTTAGHCNNIQSYYGIGLTYVGERWEYGYDIQWHRGSPFTVRNLMWDGLGTRAITGVETRSNQTVGEFVCKYGKNTGYACGNITFICIDGNNVGVRGVSVIGGDSGGPWFQGNKAYGTTHAFATFYDGTTGTIYGPVDQIWETLNISVLTY